jgi:hypothetical protein
MQIKGFGEAAQDVYPENNYKHHKHTQGKTNLETNNKHHNHNNNNNTNNNNKTSWPRK